VADITSYSYTPVPTWNVSTPYFGDWGTASNWTGGIVPNGVGKSAVFDNTVSSPTAAITNVPVILGILNIASSSRIDITGVNQGALTMEADSVTGGTAQINVSGGTIAKINLPLSFNSPTSIDAAAGSTLEIGNPINLNGQTVAMTGGGTLQFDVNFSASGGTLQANAGAVAIGAQSIISPALLAIAGNAQLSGSGTIRGAMAYDSSTASHFSGSIVGAGNSLVLNSSSGTLILSGDDTYTGGTFVDAGALILASNSAMPNNTYLTVGAGGTLIFDPSAASTPITTFPSSQINPVPEPTALALLGVAMCGAAVYRRVRDGRGGSLRLRSRSDFTGCRHRSASPCPAR
jgi:autotransporter-associated beta strand protein